MAATIAGKFVLKRGASGTARPFMDVPKGALLAAQRYIHAARCRRDSAYDAGKCCPR
jgi:hypothetical protein